MGKASSKVNLPLIYPNKFRLNKSDKIFTQGNGGKHKTLQLFVRSLKSFPIKLSERNNR